MKFVNETKIYRKKIKKEYLLNLKYELFDLINTKAQKKKTNNLKHFENSVLDLFESKLLGQTLTEFGNTEAMDNFKDLFQEQINKLFGFKTEKFPINVVRIFHPKININKLNWHQDEATWNHIENYRGKFPFTFWIPIIASKQSTLAAEYEPRKKIYYHSFLPHQGRFLGKYKSKKNKKIFIFNDINLGDFVTFSSATFHKTWLNNNEDFNYENNFLRVSVDVRFLLPNSLDMMHKTNYSKRLYLLALKNKLLSYF